MFAYLLAAVAAQSGAGSVPDTVRLDGYCRYGDAEAINLHRNILAPCNQFAFDRDGNSATFSFRRRSWGPSMRFFGTMIDGKLTVDSVAIRSNAAFKAKGSCEFRYDRGAISTAICVAKAGSKTYAANFVTSRI